MLAKVVTILFQIYLLMLFARIISSWVPELAQTKFMRFIAFYTDPYLDIFRRIIPPLGMIDISPIFAFLTLEFVRYLVLGLIK